MAITNKWPLRALLLLSLCAAAIAQVTSNLDDLPSVTGPTCNTIAEWCGEHDGATTGTATGTTTLVSTPSRDGQARKFTMTTSSYGGFRWHVYFGSGNLNSIGTIWTIDFWFYIDSLTNVDDLEFDFNHVLPSGDTIILGTQCNMPVGFWQYAVKVSTSPVWRNSSATCTTHDFIVNTWHHVVIKAHESGTTGIYDSFSVDGNLQNVGNATGTINYTLGWTPVGAQVFNFQLDGNNVTQSTTAYIDSLSITSGASGPIYPMAPTGVTAAPK